ncbi:hypothetical protein P4H83_13530 [Paenibacillus favisporus]|uniref:hypothetical protein n=1 Tax=Paenibacillus TaxID=44249 RepID=UPI0011AB892B|nr:MULTISPECIES: hypothetical protein [Paenibacillus]MEC0175888.1 hypothetical protein [Paenibacillus favisporus]
MSILRLVSNADGPINSRCIQSVDLEINNSGEVPIEMLIHGYGIEGLFYIGLIHAGADEWVGVHDIMTNYSPFELVLVTNINNLAHTCVVFKIKNQGVLIAEYTQEDTMREN